MITTEQDEQVALRETIRKAVVRESPIEKAVADGADTNGYDRDLWLRFASDIGIAALTVPESFGGLGATIAEQAIVSEEFGRELVCSPALSTIGLAVPALLASGHVAAQEEWLPRIAAGEATATVVYRGAGGEVFPEQCPVTATSVGDGWSLTGQARFVLDGHSADLLLVLADAGHLGRSLFRVEGKTESLERRRVETLDNTRAIAEVTFDGTSAELLTSGVNASRAVEHAVDVATVLLAAEQQGGAERLLEMSVEYALNRHQFGRPIASFQAIKHRCADLAMNIDRGRSAVLHATWAASDPEGTPFLGSAAATSALVCGRTYDCAAAENVQIHGGIGFTWEHSAHRYFRRAKTDLVLLADEAYYVDRLLTSVGA